jgi:hypothetical protein
VPAFDVVKIVATFIIIGVCAGALMWAYDMIAPSFNSLIATGLISHIAVQTFTVIYWSIVAYAPINLIFASIQALLVANARAETNSPFISTNINAHIVLAVVIIAAFMTDFCVSSYLDPFMIAINGLAINTLDTTNILGTMFSAVHVLCAISVGVAYLYMILNSIRVESLQWSI